VSASRVANNVNRRTRDAELSYCSHLSSSITRQLARGFTKFGECWQAIGGSNIIRYMTIKMYQDCVVKKVATNVRGWN